MSLNVPYNMIKQAQSDTWSVACVQAFSWRDIKLLITTWKNSTSKFMNFFHCFDVNLSPISCIRNKSKSYHIFHRVLYKFFIISRKKLLR